MRSDAFDQQRELWMKEGCRGGDEGRCEERDLGMRLPEDGHDKHIRGEHLRGRW